MKAISHYDSPLGGITLASDGKALTGLWFDGQKYFGSTLGSNAVQEGLPVFDQTKQWLKLYFSGRKPDFTPLLSLEGTSFQKRVWEFLLTIPYGQVMTYGEIAGRLVKETGAGEKSRGTSARAVGNAVGHNPVSLIVPCHRVIGANGSLTGYAGGIERKKKLLEMEGVDLSCAPCGKGRSLL